MGLLVIKNMNLGISSNPDPSAIPEGALADGYGFDLTKGGSLRTAGGIATHDLGDLIPSGTLQWIQEVYLGSNRYILTTTTAGLYSNGTLIDATFKGRFKAVSFGNNIYLCNGSYAKRFDGTAIYQWGITAPSSVPIIAPGTYLSTNIDTFESLATWIANQVNATIAADPADFKEGTQSMEVTVAASTLGYSYVTGTHNLSVFSSGDESTDEDYVAFWVKIDILANLDYMTLIFDGSDGTFTTDTFSYDIVSPGSGSNILQSLGVGKTVEIVAQDTGTSNIQEQELIITDFQWYYAPKTTEATTITKNVSTILVDPVLYDQVFSFWRRNDLFELKGAVWQEVKIPKKLFIAKGEPNWSTIKGVKLEVQTTASGAVTINLDQLRIIGGSDLTGDYWFTWTYSRNDLSGNIIHESSPARNSGQVIISGPVTFDRQPVTYAARGLSSDAQVNGGNLYACGGMLGEFWLIGQINDNTSVTGTISGASEKNALRTLNSQHNFPAPAGTDIVVFKNKIWMIGDPNYPHIVRTSDILKDGTLAPEGWPTRNGYLPDGNNGPLWNIDILNQQLSVKGLGGEWLLDTVDATDFLSVSAKQISNKGLLEQDALVRLQTSHIYPTHAGFVESNGQTTSMIFPELIDIVSAGMSEAQGISVGPFSYFTYYSDSYGKRTAKIDLLEGKPRFMNLNNKLFSQLFETAAEKVYGILDGGLYLLDSGTEDASNPAVRLDCYLKSRTYRMDNHVAWHWISFAHSTGDLWYILKVYVDDVLIWAEPFKSIGKEQQYFRFGPIGGYELYFTIEGSYNISGIIYFPIRISYGG